MLWNKARDKTAKYMAWDYARYYFLRDYAHVSYMVAELRYHRDITLVKPGFH